MAQATLKRRIKGYNVVPMKGLNPKGFKREVYLTNYKHSNCLICEKQLVEFLNFIPMNDTECLKVPGQYCPKCDLFFANAPTLQSIIAASETRFRSEYIIPEYSEKMHLARSCKSAVAIFHLKQMDGIEHRSVTVVCSRLDQNYNKGFYHYTHPIARQLLLEWSRQSKSVQFESSIYRILRFSYIDNGKTVLNNHIGIDRIVLRAGGGLYNGPLKRNTELVDILLFSPFTNCLEVAHASYDPAKKEYYMDAKVFRRFIHQYGNPGIPVLAYGSRHRNSDTMREESFLHAYGYTVAQDACLSDADRHLILSEVLDLGYMSAHSILCLLDHNIHMHSDFKYENARRCWEDDKNFIMGYKIDPTRFVVSNIGTQF